MTDIPFNDLRRAVLADGEIMEAVERVTRSGWYLLGEETSAFEGELAGYLQVSHVVSVASGTDALELALTALGCGPGQEVVTAANAGGYTTTAARRLGLRVRFADVDVDDLLLTPQTVEEALTPHTAVVVVTHLYGKMAPVAAIREVCHAHGVRVLEDCAQAAGARADGRPAGSIGDAAAFSFYPTKNLGALGDGGAVVTSEEETAQRVRRLRQYGWGAKYRVEEDGGRNSRLDEIQAAVLRVRLRKLDGWNRRRREIVARYADALSLTPVDMVHDGDEDYVAHLAVIRTSRRAELAGALRARGIATDVHYPVPDHRQPAIGAPEVDLPVTEAASEQVLSLPCFPALEQREVDYICSTLAGVVASLAGGSLAEGSLVGGSPR
jgi:dTDP-3-amino-2,3,6-trideoxy-4-keto-D-glucose/dTDP-3-amino-3,4,6-trideoxy-alpha-D-glucose/dTDP-2,6-dideoxy-D-kanosamine transaminase